MLSNLTNLNFKVNQIVSQFYEFIQLSYQTQVFFEISLQKQIQSFVVLHCLLGQKVPKIQQALQKIRSQELNIFKLVKNNKKIQQELAKTLKIEKVEKEGNPQTNEKNFKQKSEQIKKKKFEELRKKQEKVQNITIDSQQQLEEFQQEICLLCHQKAKNQNDLVSFVNINKTNILSWPFKSKIYEYDILKCQHKVHEDCFIKSFGSMQFFQCPLCQEVCNCIIPSNFDKKIKVKDTIWMTRAETILASHFYNDSVFQAFAKNLVYTKSLKIFIESDKNFHKKRKNIEQTLQKIIKAIYQEGTVQEKKKYMQALRYYCQQLQKQRHQTQQGNLSKKLKIFVLQMIIAILGQKSLENLSQQLKPLAQLMKMANKKYIYRLLQGIPEIIKNHQKFVQISVKIDSYYQQQEQIHKQSQKAFYELYQMPEKIEDYLKIFDLKCLKCKQNYEHTWVCLICKQGGCQKCEKSRVHIKQSHLGNCIILNSQNAKYSFYYNNFFVSNESLYKNDYNQPWSRIFSTNLNYKLNKDEMNKYFNSLLINQTPSRIDKKCLVELLNKKASDEE